MYFMNDIVNFSRCIKDQKENKISIFNILRDNKNKGQKSWNHKKNRDIKLSIRT